MNEQQKNVTTAVNPIKGEKDYSKYFHRPNITDARKRGRETVHVHRDFVIEDSIRNLGSEKKYHIQTYGCQMNEHDSEAIIGILEEIGYSKAPKQEDADIIILNTCAIRENAENKVFGELGRLMKLKRHNPDLILGVCGCMSQEEKVVNKLMTRYPQVDLIFGTHNIHRLPEYLYNALMGKERIIEVWSKEGDIIENMPRTRRGNIKAYVNIMYGCDEFCTYCIVPYTRGKERSRMPEDIIAEIEHLAQEGYQEVTLLGQNVNAYGKDFKDREYTFGDLLADLNRSKLPRIRFTTSHPRDFDAKTIAALARRGNLVEHIHLPVQSGNNEVLHRMNRKYTREMYLQLVKDIKAAIPDVALTTDIIVGFPGETEEQFQETLSLCEEVGFEGAFTFIFSAREGTPAAKMEDTVSEADKKNRLHRLNAVINRQFKEGNSRLLGKTVDVLVEGTSKYDDSTLAGYTRNYKLVNFKGDISKVGQIVKVKIDETKTWHAQGEMVEND
ncbi:MAG: tRNA (N6-isopentenyl adenosine(37)-C2)-methylthiotransferase MiaB [Turicibacter sp.]